MTLIRFYVRHEKVILPTVAETEAGFYLDVEPIEVFDVIDLNRWKTGLYGKLMRGNPLIATPERAEDPGSSILEKLNIAKWSTFETSAIMYTVHTGGRYISIYRTGKGQNGMWTQENTEHRQFASGTPLDNITLAIAEDVIKQPEANRQRTALLLASPPSTSTTPSTSATPSKPSLPMLLAPPPKEPKLLAPPLKKPTADENHDVHDDLNDAPPATPSKK